jgi:hypothetical protein
MCEKCKSNNNDPKSFIEGMMIIDDGSFYPILANAIEAFVSREGRTPSRDELCQIILSSKCNYQIANSIKPKTPASPIFKIMFSTMPNELFNLLPPDIRNLIDEIRAGMIPSPQQLVSILSKVEEVVTEKSEDNAKAANEGKCNCQDDSCSCKPEVPEKPIEVSFEECVEDASKEIQLLIRKLETKYGPMIVSNAIDDAIGCNDIAQDIDHAIERINEVDSNLITLSHNIIEFINNSKAPVIGGVPMVARRNPPGFPGKYGVMEVVEYLAHARKTMKEEMHKHKKGSNSYIKFETICQN